MKADEVVIFRECHVQIREKIWHIHKIGKRIHRDFTVDCGDIPVARYNNITGFWEHCVNPRGTAYAARRRLAYRKKKFEIASKA